VRRRVRTADPADEVLAEVWLPVARVTVLPAGSDVSALASEIEALRDRVAGLARSEDRSVALADLDDAAASLQVRCEVCGRFPGWHRFACDPGCMLARCDAANRRAAARRAAGRTEPAASQP